MTDLEGTVGDGTTTHRLVPTLAQRPTGAKRSCEMIVYFQAYPCI
jgi:hypothetical protein